VSFWRYLQGRWKQLRVVRMVDSVREDGLLSDYR
jgi:hypothetical protein